MVGKNVIRKSLVIGIIALFVGVSITPILSGNLSKNINVIIFEEIIDYFDYNDFIKQRSFLNDPPETEWIKFFENCLTHSVLQTSDGGYIVAGSNMDGGWLLKTDENGDEIWNKTFEAKTKGAIPFTFNSVKQTSDSGYIITGFKEDIHGYNQVWFVKTDSNGNLIWDKTFGETGNSSSGSSLDLTSDGGYIIVGSKNDYGPSSRDVWLIKTDANGNELWSKTFGGENYDSGFSIQQTDDNGFIITGYTYSFGGSEDLWLIKTDINGNMQWNKTFGGIDWDRGNSVQQTIDGGYIITGFTDNPGFPTYYDDLWLIKTDSNGNMQWNKTYDREYADEGFSVQQAIDGGYIISGFIEVEPENYKMWLIKTDDDGIMQWEKTFDFAIGYSVQQTNDKGYILTGYGFLIKIAPEDSYPNIVVDNIRGGFRVSADIKNIGTGIATDVMWSIDLSGGLIFLGRYTEGVIASLTPDETKTVRQPILFGIGKDVVITVTAHGSSKQVVAKWVLGPLVLGVT